MFILLFLCSVLYTSCYNFQPPGIDKDFFRIVKAGFSAKRKTLLNNLSSSLQLDKNSVEEKLKTLGISPIARAQELDIADWQKLVKML